MLHTIILHDQAIAGDEHINRPYKTLHNLIFHSEHLSPEHLCNCNTQQHLAP